MMREALILHDLISRTYLYIYACAAIDEACTYATDVGAAAS